MTFKIYTLPYYNVEKTTQCEMASLVGTLAFGSTHIWHIYVLKMQYIFIETLWDRMLMLNDH